MSVALRQNFSERERVMPISALDLALRREKNNWILRTPWSEIVMTQKKEQVEENSDRIEWLKKLYAEWEEKQLSNEIFEIEKHIVADPKELNFEALVMWLFKVNQFRLNLTHRLKMLKSNIGISRVYH